MKARQSKANKGQLFDFYTLSFFYTVFTVFLKIKHLLEKNSAPSILDLERALTHIYKKIMSVLIEKIYY